MSSIVIIVVVLALREDMITVRKRFSTVHHPIHSSINLLFQFLEHSNSFSAFSTLQV